LLPGLAAATVRRRAIAAALRAAAPGLGWQDDHADHVHHLAVFRAEDRSTTRDRLATRGVASAIHYPLALTQQPAYRDLTRAECPEAEAWAGSCISVPCFPELTDAEIALVIAALEALNDG
jgi:dTDP-4-amino-4,6-dideoxygalactose transaminase